MKSEEIEKQIQEFLANGGEIEIVDSSVFAIRETGSKRSKQENIDRLKRAPMLPGQTENRYEGG